MSEAVEKRRKVSQDGTVAKINFMGTCAMNKKMVSSAKNELREKYGNSLIGEPEWELGKLFYTVEYTDEVSEVMWTLTTMEKIFVVVAKIDQLKSKDENPSAKIKEFESFGQLYDWSAALQNHIKVTNCGGSVPSFKVFCKRKGVHFDSITREDIAAALAGGVQDATGWKIDLKNPTLQVVCTCNDQGILLALQAAKQSTNRNYISQTGLKGLHPTVSWFIARCAEPLPGDFILDTCCGRGIILGEAFSRWPKSHYFGSDISTKQLNDATTNFKTLQSPVELLHCDMTKHVFKCSSFDVIYADLPFGRQHGSLSENQQLYPPALAECSRMLSPGGRLVILTDANNTALLRSSVESTGFLSLIRRRWLRLGTTDAQVYIFKKELTETMIDWSDSALSKPFKWEGRSWAETCAKERTGMVPT